MRKSLSDYRTVIAHIAADRGESQGRLAFLRAYGASVSWTDAGRMVREQIVAEHTSAEYRYIAAVCLRKAVETMGDGEPLRPFRTRMLRTARAHEAEAKAELDAAHKACEDAGIPVNSSPILPLL